MAGCAGAAIARCNRLIFFVPLRARLDFTGDRGIDGQRAVLPDGLAISGAAGVCRCLLDDLSDHQPRTAGIGDVSMAAFADLGRGRDGRLAHSGRRIVVGVDGVGVWDHGGGRQIFVTKFMRWRYSQTMRQYFMDN